MRVFPYAPTSRFLFALLALALRPCAPAATAQTGFPVLTRSYDNARTGANTQESVLTPAKVRSGLKLLHRLAIPDDQRIEAQPLYVPGIRMSDNQTHDVVYVCSMANTIWAFDANDGTKIWPAPVSLGTPVKGKPVPPHEQDPNFPNRTDIDLWGINDHWGILSTPVIDLDTKTMYVINWSIVDSKPVHRLHALDITNGSPRHPPLVIEASSALANPPARFDSALQKQRSALLLVPLRQTGTTPVKKTLYMACGLTKESAGGKHGWLIAFDVDSFRQTAAWCTTPKGQGGGIWQAGQGPCADEEGDVYLMTSNGDWNGTTDFSESFVKLRYTPPTGPTLPGALALIDWWTPFKDEHRGFKDQDLGSGGPVVPPGLGLVLGAGKDGVLYVFDKNNLGKSFQDFSKLKQPPIYFTYFPGFQKDPKVDLDFLHDDKTHHLHGSPVFWNSPERGGMLFNWGENENLRVWKVNASGKVPFLARSNETASAGLPPPGGMPGGMLTLSANGQTENTGIIWSTAPIHGDANKFVVDGILRAHDATTFKPIVAGTQRLDLLWDSGKIGHNFKYDKFCPPVVADGKVFVATYDGHVDVYAPAP